MKVNNGKQAGPAPPVLAMIALLLAIGVAGTTPIAFTQAKYTAQGMVTASARVAKWQIEYYSDADGDYPRPNSVAYLGDTWRNEGPKYNDGKGTMVAAQHYNFCVFNYSEVAAIIEIKLRCEDSDGTRLPYAVTKNSPSALSLLGNAGQGLANYQYYIDPGSSNGVTKVDTYQFRFAPGPSWAWFSFDAKPITTHPTLTTSGYSSLQNCMRSYKVFVDAVQVD